MPDAVEFQSWRSIIMFECCLISSRVNILQKVIVHVDLISKYVRNESDLRMCDEWDNY